MDSANSSTESDRARACVLVSGGLDSAACLEFMKSKGFDLTALHVDLGQAAASEEKRAAQNLCNHYGIPIQFARWLGDSDRGSGEIVGRNAFLIFAAVMECPSDGLLVIGIHSGTSYFDCGTEFVSEIQNLLSGYSNGRTQVLAPFLTWDKRQVWEFCVARNVPVELTYSCERGGNPPCGSCLSCKDRKALDALANLNHSA